MTPADQAPDLQRAADKFTALNAAVNTTLARVRRRNHLTLFGAGVFALFTFFYLLFAYLKFGSIDPEFTADYAQAQLQGYLPVASEQLERQLKQSAPDVIRVGEEQLRAMPQRLASETKARALRELEARAPEVEKGLYDALSDRLRLQIAQQAADKSLVGVGDDKRFALILDKLAVEAEHYVDGAYDRYVTVSRGYLDYLDTLALNRKLDREQTLHRQMLVSFLRLVRKHHPKPDSPGPQPRLMEAEVAPSHPDVPQ